MIRRRFRKDFRVFEAKSSYLSKLQYQLIKYKTICSELVGLVALTHLSTGITLANLTVTMYNDTNVSNPNYLVAAGTTAYVVYSVNNTSGSTTFSGLTYIPPENMVTSLFTTSTCLSLTAGLGPNTSCNLVLEFVAPTTSGTYDFGPVSVCSTSPSVGCSSNTGSSELTVNVTGADLAFITSATGIDVINTSTLALVKTFVSGAGSLASCTGPAWTKSSYSGNWVYVGCTGGINEVMVINANTLGVSGHYNTNIHTPNGVTVTPDNKYVLVTNGASGTLSVINAEPTMTQNKLITVGTTPMGIDTTLNNTYAFVANSGANTLSILSLTGLTGATGAQATSTVPFGVTVTPDQSAVWVANSTNNSYWMYNTTSFLQQSMSITMPGNTKMVAFRSDGTKAYSANSSTSNVSVVYLPSGTIINTGEVISVGTFPSSIYMAPDGVTAYVPNNGATSLSIINTTEDAVTATLTATNGINPNPRYVAFLP